MRFKPKFKRGVAEAHAVDLTLTEKDAVPLSIILSYAARAYEQEGNAEDCRAARRIFNLLAAACEHLSSDARTFAEEQMEGSTRLYHKTRKQLDPGYESEALT